MHSWKMTKTARTKNLSRASDRECYRLVIRWRKMERRIKQEISGLGPGFLSWWEQLQTFLQTTGTHFNI